MSRSGYTDDCDDGWELIRWRGAVQSAIKGARGQAFLRELAAAMDAMPEKVLVEGELQSDGAFCALGLVGRARGVDLLTIDTENWDQLSQVFGIAESMAREIMYENDEGVAVEEWVDVEICGPMRLGRPDWGNHVRSVRKPILDAGERRWQHMRKWVNEHLNKD